MKRALASLILASIVTACAAPTARVGIPEGYGGDVVQLSGVVLPGPIGVLAGEAFCNVVSLDGSAIAREYFFQPGTHTVRLSMTNMGYHYDGVTQMQFATPGKYELFIKRDGRRFDVSTRRVPNGEVVETISLNATKYVPLMVPIVVK
jgi:hypothetical protein